MTTRTQVVGQQVLTVPEVKSAKITFSGTMANVHLGPAMLCGVIVNTSMNGYSANICDGTSGPVVDVIPASSPAGYTLTYFDTSYANTISIVFNSSLTGDVSVKYIPLA